MNNRMLAVLVEAYRSERNFRRFGEVVPEMEDRIGNTKCLLDNCDVDTIGDFQSMLKDFDDSVAELLDHELDKRRCEVGADNVKSAVWQIVKKMRHYNSMLKHKVDNDTCDTFEREGIEIPLKTLRDMGVRVHVEYDGDRYKKVLVLGEEYEVEGLESKIG